MAAPTVCVFEDEKAENFLPLAYTRPVFDLRCGMRTLFKKISLVYNGCTIRQLCRPYLIRVADSQNQPSLIGNSRDLLRSYGQILFLNGRLLARRDLDLEITPDGEDALYVCGDDLVAARLSGPRLTIGLKWLAEQDTESVMATIAREVRVQRVEVEMVAYPWDLIHRNGREIVADFDMQRLDPEQAQPHPAAAIYNRDRVFVDPSAEIMAGAVLDARDGPIYIDEGAVIQPFSFVQGPCYIGRYVRIVGGKVREDTSIGPYCRVGGEVECSIFHAYTNKYHDGFVGHSYLGEWVNVGAMTTTSDLKNTYGSIRIELQDRQLDTGLTKLGALVGDHVKLGIGVLLNSGSTIGTGCNLFGGGMLPKVVPCFVWGGDGSYQEYDFERMLQTAQIAMSRRDVERTEVHTEMLRYVFDITGPLRRAGRI
ncbi:MAG TPA: putative sugar nucleotidyl transferase [Chloroflexota bacterium]|nr:putative sugar nucleotidyl transferase [Chloroflexota bacterium]